MQIMLKYIKNLVTIIIVSLTLFTHSFDAMGQEAAAGGDASSILFEDSLTDAYTVMGTTAGGAVLGLSTLSFVENPSDHFKRVVVAGALGLIVGVALIAYKTANASSNLYLEGVRSHYRPQVFSTSDRVAWHQTEHSQLNSSELSSQVGYQFSF